VASGAKYKLLNFGEILNNSKTKFNFKSYFAENIEV
jgi:hypothetical protein